MQLDINSLFLGDQDRENFNRFAELCAAEEAVNKRVMLSEWEAVARRVESARTSNLTRHHFDGIIDLSAFRGEAGSPSKGQIKLTAYAHNRMTISAYQGGARVVGKRLKSSGLAALLSTVGNFNICRETRQSLKIGGRWRDLPLETQFTNRARNWIRDGGYLLESEVGGTPLFLTLTIPTQTKEGLRTLSVASGYIVDRFNRYLRYRCLNGWFLYVWEVQKRGTPHLHFMFKMASDTNFKKFYREIRTEWRKILLDVSEQTGVDLFDRGDGFSWKDSPNHPVINFRVIKTSVAGYLSKYASKRRSKGGARNSWFPGRWWGISYPLRREVLARRCTIVLGLSELGGAKTTVHQVISRLGELCVKLWKKDSEIDCPGEFASIQTPPGTSKRVCEAIGYWLVFGDLTALTELQRTVRGSPGTLGEILKHDHE